MRIQEVKKPLHPHIRKRSGKKQVKSLQSTQSSSSWVTNPSSMGLRKENQNKSDTCVFSFYKQFLLSIVTWSVAFYGTQIHFIHINQSEIDLFVWPTLCDRAVFLNQITCCMWHNFALNAIKIKMFLTYRSWSMTTLSRPLASHESMCLHSSHSFSSVIVDMHDSKSNNL